MSARILIVGGGAAGYFAAITAAEADPRARVAIREATGQVLAKVRISGGGRCNVTHACFDPRELVRHYPRGARELRGAFSRFQPADTVAWFAARGVELTTEADGRMFPVSDDSATIVDCLRGAADAAGVELRTRSPVRTIARGEEGLLVDDQAFDRVCLATGGSRQGHALAAALGHRITEIAPSLFTFVVRDPRLRDLAGVSVPDAEVRLRVGEMRFVQRGPLLITHWGLSGPAVLRLSAWAARELQASAYRGELRIAWSGDADVQRADAALREAADAHPRRAVASHDHPVLPRRLWQRLAAAAGIEADRRWAELGKRQRLALAEEIARCPLRVTGKGRFKEEFVTCGGIALDEIDTRRMASRLVPGLFAVGELLDVDGITGGFNFQHAWTSGRLAGLAMIA